jgi:hypothetical protein
LRLSIGSQLPASLRRTCWWALEGHVLAGPHPFAPGRSLLGSLLDLGVTDFVDLTQPGEAGTRDYAAAARGAARMRGIETLVTRTPIPDMGTPPPAEARRILDHLAARVATGEITYMHCRAGIGRSGTVAALLLVERGSSPPEACAEVNRRRRETDFAQQRSPETAEQLALISGWRPGAG